MTVLVALKQAGLGFPKYVVQYSLGLLVAILTDFIISTLALAGVFIGLATGSLWIGLASFFVLYGWLRIVGNLAEAVGFGLRALANNLSSDSVTVTTEL